MRAIQFAADLGQVRPDLAALSLPFVTGTRTWPRQKGTPPCRAWDRRGCSWPFAAWHRHRTWILQFFSHSYPRAKEVPSTEKETDRQEVDHYRAQTHTPFCPDPIRRSPIIGRPGLPLRYVRGVVLSGKSGRWLPPAQSAL